MDQIVNIPAELLFTVIGAFGIYIFFDFKKQVQGRFEEVKNESIIMEKKIEKIEAGEFVEKIVKNVIYSPESRQYFSTIFTEALKHQNKNYTAANLSILDFQEEINKKLEEINDKLPKFLKN
jgi:hypothetical protein